MLRYFYYPCYSFTHGQPRPQAADRPSTRLGEPSTVPGRVEGGGQPVQAVVLYFYVFQLSSFPLILRLLLGA